jgi:hypothetical protein
MRYYELQHLTPQEELPFFEWWLPTRKQIHKLQRKGFDSLALLVVMEGKESACARQSRTSTGGFGAIDPGGSSEMG